MSNEDQTTEQTAVTLPDATEHGIDLFGVAVAILSEWRLGVITFFLVTLACVALIVSLKPQFVATATLLPQEGRSEGGGSLNSLFSYHGPGVLYMGLAQSRSVQDNVIQRANLMQLFHVTSMENAREILTSKSSFSEAADTIVTITVRDGNAKDAARIANSYLDALADKNQSMAFQQGSQTAQFFEEQLGNERQQLAAAEGELARTQKNTGLVAPESQTQIGLSAIAATRTEITTREVELAALLQSETEKNPHVQTLRSQIAQLKAQEHLLEGNGGSPAGAALPAGQMPQNNLDIQRAQREVKYHESLVTSLANEFETARLNELFSRAAFQVVDRAVAPEHKAWPPRKPFFLASIAFAALCGLAAVIAKLTWLRVIADPEHKAQLMRLRRAFGSR